MQHILKFGLFIVLIGAVFPAQADVVRVIKDPSECGEEYKKCANCGNRYRHRCYECNPYKRSCVDDEDVEPLNTWPSYWDQPLQEELSR